MAGCGHLKGAGVLAVRSSYVTPVISLIIEVFGD
jgi:hypothetical protein